jgi:lysine 6-dehydrogenase
MSGDLRVVLLGAGLQAQAACYDLVQQTDLASIVVADTDLGRAKALAERWGDPRIEAVAFDAGDEAAATELMRGAQAALSAVPYRFNAGLARAAVAAGCSFCDLGGNNDTVNQELALHEQAKAAGVTIVPDCGLAPGMVAVVVADAVATLDETESVEIRVGGLPQERGGPLDYSLFFNVQGLINEYVEDAVVLEDGEPKVIPSLDHFETLEFPAPFGTLEAFTTSGGTSTLPETYRGRVQRLNYKTMRYPGHGRVFQGMHTLGLLSWDEVEVDGVKISPRAVNSAAMVKVLDRGDPDVALMRTTAIGTRDGARVRRTYQMIEYPQHGLTAMMRTTAFPATVVALMLARGEIEQKGALPQERCVDPPRFLEELGKRGMDIQITEEPQSFAKPRSL